MRGVFVFYGPDKDEIEVLRIATREWEDVCKAYFRGLATLEITIE
jgi:hypothetical protein